MSSWLWQIALIINNNSAKLPCFQVRDRLKLGGEFFFRVILQNYRVQGYALLDFGAMECPYSSSVLFKRDSHCPSLEIANLRLSGKDY